MKKFLLAFVASCIGLGCMAGSAQMIPASDHLSMGSKGKDLKKNAIAKMPATIKKIAPGISDMKDIISSVDGEKVDVLVTTSGITLSGFGFTEYSNQMMASHIVYGENNDVYIYELFPYLPYQSYIKGVKDGNKITVDLPQPIYYDDSEGYVEAYYLTLMNNSDDWYYSEEKSTLTLNIDESGKMTAEGLSPEYILGVADSEDGTWIGLGAWELSISKSTFDNTPVSLPSGYEVVENYWTSVGNGYGWQVSYAKGENDIYFQGLAERFPEAWVKGSVVYNGNIATISIPQDQYVGDYNGYHIFTKCVKLITDENGNVFYDEDELMDPNYEFKIVWDIEKETMTAVDKDVVLLFNASINEIHYLNDLYDLKLIHQESFEGIPADPHNLAFEDAMLEEGFSIFSFSLPAVSTEGKYLKLDDLSYVVYVNDDVWTFDAEDYKFEDSMEEIPWTFEGYWVGKEFASNVHVAAFFVEGISTLGVQTIYRYNGVETLSEIVTLDLENPNYVAGIDADKKVASVKYFDVAGREIANSASGVVIKHVIYEDGSVDSFKKIAR